MKKTITFLLALVLGTTVYSQQVWDVDASHSKVNFSVSHLVISEVDGTFKTFEGSLLTETENFSNASIKFEIDANSINTDNDQRDGHLKSEDFFHAEKFPKITFKSTSFKKGRKNKYVLKGELTMRGVTKNVKLKVIYGGIAKDGYGNTKAGFKISGELNRIDFGIAWNSKTEQGGFTVGEEINFVVKLEFVKK
jgi:polyisoprenoid-binding protein YceI